jgi:hypothetical protein
VRFFINVPRSYEWLIEGDVEDCFGSIHHGLLMEQVRRRVTDKRVLRLIRRFLAAGIMREHGALAATPSGTPQGSGLSPLLANIALSVVDRHFEDAWTARRWHSQRARDRAAGRPSYRMIRYADDFGGAGARNRGPSTCDQGADGRVHAGADAFDALAREDSGHPRRRRLRPVGVPHCAEAVAGEQARRLHVPEPASVTRGHAPHQDADQPQHDEPLARSADPRAQPHPARMGQLLSPRCEQPLLRLLEPLRVVAGDPVAAQEVPAADLETDQATVLGAPLDRPRGREARLARRGSGDPISLSRPPHPLAVGGYRNRSSHHSTGSRRCLL